MTARPRSVGVAVGSSLNDGASGAAGGWVVKATAGGNGSPVGSGVAGGGAGAGVIWVGAGAGLESIVYGARAPMSAVVTYAATACRPGGAPAGGVNVSVATQRRSAPLSSRTGRAAPSSRPSQL